MKTVTWPLAALACLLASAAAARADLIVAQSFTQSGGVPVNLSSLNVWVELTTNPSYTWPVAPLFNLALTPADVGKTFTANASSPNFAGNISLATNGNNDRVGLFAGFAGSLDYESEFFHGQPHTPAYTGTADLKGYTIDHVTLTVNSLTLTPNRSHDNFTDYSFDGTVSFYGSSAVPATAPEPASLGLALLGALGIAGYRGRAWRALRK